MGGKVSNHLHRYKKVNLSQTKTAYFVYRCTKPACNHYIPVVLAEGKLCECNKCGEPMLITKAVLNGSTGKPLARPHCAECLERKNKKDVEAIAQFLQENK